jgi:outer membrane protein W
MFLILQSSENNNLKECAMSSKWLKALWRWRWRVVCGGGGPSLRGGRLDGRAGIWGVFPEIGQPDQASGQTARYLDVDDGYSLGFNITYMATPNIGIELLGALPFRHDINLSGRGKVGEHLQQLPPTLFVQYHFMPSSNVRPYVGVGLNYTFFFLNEDHRRHYPEPA